MRNLITSAGIGIAGFAAGIALVVSCSRDGSGDSGFVATTLETLGLEETAASAEPGLEETCGSWRVYHHDLTPTLPETFDPPPGQFPFAVLTGGSYYLFTRTCLD
jgi:hypothetical protein